MSAPGSDRAEMIDQLMAELVPDQAFVDNALIRLAGSLAAQIRAGAVFEWDDGDRGAMRLIDRGRMYLDGQYVGPGHYLDVTPDGLCLGLWKEHSEAWPMLYTSRASEEIFDLYELAAEFAAPLARNVKPSALQPRAAKLIDSLLPNELEVRTRLAHLVAEVALAIDGGEKLEWEPLRDNSFVAKRPDGRYIGVWAARREFGRQTCWFVVGAYDHNGLQQRHSWSADSGSVPAIYAAARAQGRSL